MHSRSLARTSLLVTALALGLGTGAAGADEIVSVSLDTSSLAGSAGSELVFELTDGSGLGDANNTVTISNLTLGGGTPGAIDLINTFGGVTGDLGSGNVTLTDSSFLNVFAQFLTPGSNVSFRMDLTTNVDAGPIPDGFFAYIYDPSGNPIDTTSDPSGFDSLLAVNFDSSTPEISDYDPALVHVAGAATGVPEPNSLLLAASAFAIVAGLRRRRRSPR